MSEQRARGNFAPGRGYVVPEIETCAYPHCWDEPDAAGRWRGLCARHAAKVDDRAAGEFCAYCCWPRCPERASEGPLCGWHAKVASGIAAPVDRADREAVLLEAISRGGGDERVGTRGVGAVQRYVARRAHWLAQFG